MAVCRQLENGPPLCRLPGPAYFRPGKFKGAWALGSETIVYSVEEDARTGKKLGLAPSCRVKKVGEAELPYYCWAENGYTGKPDRPVVAATSWHAMTVDGIDQQTADLVQKFGLHDNVWEELSKPGIPHFERGYTSISTFPHWATAALFSVVSLILVFVCAVFVGTRVWMKLVEMRSMISDLRTEINDLRTEMLSIRTEAATREAAIRIELTTLKRLSGDSPNNSNVG